MAVTQEPTMSRVKRYFSKEFKVGAVKLVTEQGYSIGEAARRLEVDRKCLHDWIGKFAPGYDPAVTGADVSEDPKALQAELRRLRRECDQLRMERDILKKATAYFAREQP
jgi:transposase